MTPFQTYREMNEARGNTPDELSHQAHKTSDQTYNYTKPGHQHAMHTWAYKEHETARAAHADYASQAEGPKKKHHEMMAAHHAQMAAHHKEHGMPGNW